MKAPLKSCQQRPSPTEAVRIAAEAAPELPPARLPTADKQLPYSTKFRSSTLVALDRKAREQGTSVKAVIAHALAAAAVELAPADLEDRTPRRRGLA